MTHILLAAILFVLVYALLWRPWRLYRAVRRSLAPPPEGWDYSPLQRQSLPAPPYVPQPSRWPDVGRLVAWVVACVAIIATVILAT